MKNSAIGQVSPTRFIHRIYEEKGVQITFATFFNPDDTDVVGGYAVQTHREGVIGAYNAINANVFGPGPGNFEKAAAEFKQRVAGFLERGIL